MKSRNMNIDQRDTFSSFHAAGANSDFIYNIRREGQVNAGTLY